MEETLDVEALMKAAAQAARRNEAPEAAALLRRVLTLQEAALGPDHLELAPNLNNLALMLERQGDNVEAERCYRHAYDIVRRAAGPDDPLAKVARANLVEFLQATGKLDPLRDDIEDEGPPPQLSAHDTSDDPAPPRLTFAPPATAPAPRADPRKPAPLAEAPQAGAPARAALAPTPAAPRATTPAPAPVKPAPPPQPAPSQQASLPRETRDARQGGRTRLWVVAGVAAALVVAAWLFVGRTDRAPVTAAVEAPITPTAPSEASIAAPTRPDPPPPAPAPAAPAAPEPAAPARSASLPRAASGAVTVLAADASLCQRLTRNSGAWRCDPIAENGRTDAVYYYTRVKSPRDVVLRHRWSYEGKPVQTVNLQVRANATEGFRTFSHQRVAGRPGRWDVALITSDGSVVDTRQFTVAP
jgi:hypothetical protein